MDQAREEEAYRQAAPSARTCQRRASRSRRRSRPPTRSALSGYHLRELRELRRLREERSWPMLLEVERSHVRSPTSRRSSSPRRRSSSGMTRGQFDNWADWSKYRIDALRGRDVRRRRARPALRAARPAEQDGRLRRPRRPEDDAGRGAGPAGQASTASRSTSTRRRSSTRRSTTCSKTEVANPNADPADEDDAGHGAEEDPGPRSPVAVRRDVHHPPRRDRDHHRRVRRGREGGPRLPGGRPGHRRSPTPSTSRRSGRRHDPRPLGQLGLARRPGGRPSSVHWAAAWARLGGLGGQLGGGLGSSAAASAAGRRPRRARRRPRQLGGGLGGSAAASAGRRLRRRSWRPGRASRPAGLGQVGGFNFQGNVRTWASAAASRLHRRPARPAR